MPRQSEELEKESSYAVRKGHADLVYQMDLRQVLKPSADLAPKLLQHSKGIIAMAENIINLYSQKRAGQKQDLKAALASLREAHGSLELAYSYDSGASGSQKDILHSKAVELYKNVLAVKCLLGPSTHRMAMIALASKARMPFAKG